MRRIFTLLAVLCVGLSGAVWAAHAVGKAQRMEVDRYFSRADGSPCEETCLLGVIPGQMSFFEAERLLREHPEVRGRIITERPSGNLLELITIDRVFTLLRGWQNEVVMVSVRYEADPGVILPADWADQAVHPDGLGALGEALYRFGTPEGVTINRRNPRAVRLFYPAYGMILLSETDEDGANAHLDMGDRITYLGLSAPDWYRSSWSTMLIAATDWIGFGSVSRYLRASR